MTSESPSYYAIIPASVRYDDKLTANQKLLYGEISALCNREGYSWALNGYFANLYKKNIWTISRWMSNLKKQGYIYTVYTERNQRHIYLTATQKEGVVKKRNPLAKKRNPPCEKAQTAFAKKRNHNNKKNIIINKDFKKKKDLRMDNEEWLNKIASEYGQTAIERILPILTSSVPHSEVTPGVG